MLPHVLCTLAEDAPCATQVKLISLLTSCGLKVDDSSLGEVIETHLSQAAHARYRSLKASIGKPRGLHPATPSH